MIFSGIKGITIPEGAVKQIADGAGNVLWSAIVDVATMAVKYTGAFSDQADVVMSGKTYRLLTLTGSGTLSLPGSVVADVWLCHGGNGGTPPTSAYHSGRYGGGGGKVKQADGITIGKTTVCVIGAGGAAQALGGVTSFGDITPGEQDSSPQNGASGGGNSGVGDGVETIPFANADMFDQHSAGGGGGGKNYRPNTSTARGGKGGSNGASGSAATSNYTTGGAGGEKGGGEGGSGANTSSSTNDGGNATFYGSGGGGGGGYTSKDGETVLRGTPGNGYQGVIYIRIPYEQ